jgi:hypothetical protein
MLLVTKGKIELILDLQKASALGFQIASTRHNFRIFRHISAGSLIVRKKLLVELRFDRWAKLSNKIVVYDARYIVYDALQKLRFQTGVCYLETVELTL